jgi:hypothetical protein
VTHIVVDPDEVGQLYQRCIRCLYLKYRKGRDVGALGGREWATSIVGYHAEDEWVQVLKGPRFRFRSYGEIVESRAINYAEAGIALSFAGRFDALLEFEDGAVGLAKCLESAPESAPKMYQWGLNGYAFALQHPRTTRVEPIDVKQLAVLEFKLTPAAGGKSIVTPRRVTSFPRDADRFSKWARVVARLLAASVAPRETCAVCKEL